MPIRSHLGVLMLAILLTGSCARHSPSHRPGSAPPAEALFTAVERQTCVLFLGSVQTRAVPWSEGLTLAQALVVASYTRANDPRLIVLHRAGVPTHISPSALLTGADIPVEPGDLVEILP